MSKELKLQLLTVRRNLLEQRNPIANMNLINKINRQIRRLEQQK
jgi:hypothetical protein